jgi:hypothetical protein
MMAAVINNRIWPLFVLFKLKVASSALRRSAMGCDARQQITS